MCMLQIANTSNAKLKSCRSIVGDYLCQPGMLFVPVSILSVHLIDVLCVKLTWELHCLV